MADLKALLRRLADELEKEEAAEEAGKSTAAIEERIASLEAKIAAASKDDVDDAVEEISDEEWELIRQHRAGPAKPKPSKPKPEREDKPRRTRPGRKSGQAYDWTVDDDGEVRRVDIAHIYNGEDEPDEVDLPEREVA